MIYEIKGNSIYIDGEKKISNLRMNVIGKKSRIKFNTTEEFDILIQNVKISPISTTISGIELYRKLSFIFNFKPNLIKKNIHASGMIGNIEIDTYISNKAEMVKMILETFTKIKRGE